MSKAFTREDDVVDEPLVRSDEAGPRYITAQGAARLHGQLAELRAADAPHDTVQHHLSHIDQLVVVTPRQHEQVAFGHTVTLRAADDPSGPVRVVRIVGIDEAHASDISWRSPLARALVGAQVGDIVTVETPRGDDELEVVAIQ